MAMQAEDPHPPRQLLWVVLGTVSGLGGVELLRRNVGTLLIGAEPYWLVPPDESTQRGLVSAEAPRFELWGNPGEGVRSASFPSSGAMCSLFTQIYEGTNQVQRIVMARQLLKG